MNVKKYFCCVPIINVRQSVTVSHDKGTQLNGFEPEHVTAGNHEVYKNVAFRDEDRGIKDPGGVNNCNNSIPTPCNLDARRSSELSQESKDSTMSNGKPKTLCFNDIVVANLNGSSSSVNTDRSSNQSSFIKVGGSSEIYFSPGIKKYIIFTLNCQNLRIFLVVLRNR